MKRYSEFNIDTLEWGETFDTEKEALDNASQRPDAENWAVFASVMDGGIWQLQHINYDVRLDNENSDKE